MEILLGISHLLLVTAAVFEWPAPPFAVASEPLQFVTVLRAGGCPLTLYFPSNKDSREAYLSPAFCVTKDFTSLLSTVSLEYDALLKSSYLAVPVTVTDSRLLDEARETLRSLLQGRTLDFLQPLGLQEAMWLEMPVTMVTQPPDSVIAFVRWRCVHDDCNDILSQLANGRCCKNVADLPELKATLGIPGSQPITVTRKIVTANQSRVLTPLASPSVHPAPGCTNLKLHQVLTVDEFCTVTVLKRTDSGNHFAIEPMLCYYGNYSIRWNGRGQELSLSLEVKSDRVRNLVSTSLSSLSPESVNFMSLVGAELRVSKFLSGPPEGRWDSKWRFESLRLEPGGDRLELIVECNQPMQLFRGTDDCGKFVSHLTNNSRSLWRHFSVSVESQLHGYSTACTWQRQATVSHSEERGPRIKYLSDYYPINGLSCIKPEYVNQHAVQHLSKEFCASLCSIAPVICPAFRIHNDSCQLFVFNRCSIDVMNSRCDMRSEVFVRMQPELEPGRLCSDALADPFVVQENRTIF